MNHRERIRTIISGKTPDHCGLWMGNPHPDSWPGLHAYFKTNTPEDFYFKLQDDFRWITPAMVPNTYRHPTGRDIFDLGFKKTHHGQAGPLSTCETVQEVNAYEWPNPDYTHFDTVVEMLRNAGDAYRASGMWTPFYHNVMDLMGMENYMMMMHSNPAVVHAITDRVCEFYYESNERLFKQAGNLIDGFFFGNDFGTQLDLIVGPRQFDQFILPWFRRFTEQGHKHGYQVILHSCGSIYKVIPRLIDAGVDCLHPLQAKASNMDAATLAREFKGKIAFMGGIDTQDLLAHGTPQQVRDDVRRVRDLLEPNLIVSPSHEAILPDVRPENVEALAQAALE